MKVKGFTLIELVMVMVILGVLSVVAAPRFLNLSNNAKLAALKQLAGSIRSATEMSHMAFVLSGTDTSKSINAHKPDFPKSLLPYCQPTCYFKFGYPQDGKTIEHLLSGVGEGEELVYAGNNASEIRFSFRSNVNNPDSMSPALRQEFCYVWYKQPVSNGSQPEIGVVSC